MSAGHQSRSTHGPAPSPNPPNREEMRAAPRYTLRRSIWFRARGALPAPGLLLNISERGALAQFDAAKAAENASWPLRLRHGDELWLYNVIPEPLCCWVVSVERDLIRLRLFSDTDVLPALRKLIMHLASEQATARSLAEG
jgi:hypothetical protein